MQPSQMLLYCIFAFWPALGNAVFVGYSCKGDANNDIDSFWMNNLELGFDGYCRNKSQGSVTMHYVTNKKQCMPFLDAIYYKKPIPHEEGLVYNELWWIVNGQNSRTTAINFAKMLSTKQLVGQTSTGPEATCKMLFMDHKRTCNIPLECTGTSSWNFESFGSSAIYGAVHTFFSEANFFESTKYIIDERPRRMASRLVQLCDDFDKEFMPGDRCSCHILSFLLMHMRWLLWY